MEDDNARKSGPAVDPDVENLKLRATRELIESLNLGSSPLPLSSTLPLARRILESSIGTISTTNTTTTTSTTTTENDENGTKRTNDRSDTPSIATPRDSVLRQLLRSYRRTAKTSPPASDAAKDLIEREYRRLWASEGENVANGVAVLLRRLAGTGTKHNGRDHQGRSEAERIVNDAPNPDWLGGNERGTDEEREVRPSPSPASVQPGVRSFAHVSLAIREEETSVLRECLRALQNVEGENVRFHTGRTLSHGVSGVRDRGDGALEHHPGMRIRPGLLPFHMDVGTCVEHRGTRMLGSGSMDALRLCGEAGWLYARIQSYIATVMERRVGGADGGAGAGAVEGRVVPRALASALTKELKSYHTLLADLERDLVRQSSEETFDRNFTARRLVVQLRRPITNLRTTTLLVDGTSTNLNGGQLLAALYLHSMHGDVRHCKLVNRVLRSTAIPWYDLRYDWTMRWILTTTTTTTAEVYRARNAPAPTHKKNSGGEFFITKKYTVDNAFMWHGRFELAQHQIPHMPGIGIDRGILSGTLANKVLVVGKGINFIRRCLHDTQWNLDLRDMLP